MMASSDEGTEGQSSSNAEAQLQAHYRHCGEAASAKCLSAATFVKQRANRYVTANFRAGRVWIAGAERRRRQPRR